MGFKCSGCGCCCKRVKNAAEWVAHIPELRFPYNYDVTGRCEMLGEDNRCKVYDQRPLICNVDALKEFYKMDEKEWYALNTKACNDMMDADAIPARYRV